MHTCTECGKQFTSAARLERHHTWVHTDSRKNYPCTKPGCNYVAKQATDLQKHMEAHRRAIRRHIEDRSLPTDYRMHRR
jgi:hypothetical protein